LPSPLPFWLRQPSLLLADRRRLRISDELLKSADDEGRALSHPPGKAQVDFGHGYVEVDGDLIQAALSLMTLPYSDAMQAFPWECTEAFQEVHKRAVEFFGGVPRANQLR
jgi:transposase